MLWDRKDRLAHRWLSTGLSHVIDVAQKLGAARWWEPEGAFIYQMSEWQKRKYLWLILKRGVPAPEAKRSALSYKK